MPRICTPPGMSFPATYSGTLGYAVGVVLASFTPSIPTFHAADEAEVFAGLPRLSKSAGDNVSEPALLGLRPLTFSSQSTPHWIASLASTTLVSLAVIGLPAR